MRILAELRTTQTFHERALPELKEKLADHGLIAVIDDTEISEVMDQLVSDMSPDDRRRFQRTVRHVAKDPVGGTVASVSVLEDRYFMLRLRNATLQGLLPVGHDLLSALMSDHGPHASNHFELRKCEVRERGTGQAFLFGTWQGGVASFWRFLFEERRANFIVLLLTIGLLLEVILTLADAQSRLAELGLRLGAPMLVSSLVLILERRAQFRDQREPRLRWTTSPGSVFAQDQGAPQVAPILQTAS